MGSSAQARSEATPPRPVNTLDASNSTSPSSVRNDTTLENDSMNPSPSSMTVSWLGTRFVGQSPAPSGGPPGADQSSMIAAERSNSSSDPMSRPCHSQSR